MGQMTVNVCDFCDEQLRKGLSLKTFEKNYTISDGIFAYLKLCYNGRTTSPAELCKPCYEKCLARVREWLADEITKSQQSEDD